MIELIGFVVTDYKIHQRFRNTRDDSTDAMHSLALGGWLDEITSVVHKFEIWSQKSGRYIANVPVNPLNFGITDLMLKAEF